MFLDFKTQFKYNISHLSHTRVKITCKFLIENFNIEHLNSLDFLTITAVFLLEAEHS